MKSKILTLIDTNKSRLLNLYQLFIATFGMFMFANPLFATSNTIWDTSTSAGSTMWNNIKTIYIDALFLPLIGISLIGWAVFAKNDKVRAGFATAVKAEIVVFIALQVPDVAKGTFNNFAQLLNGGS